MNETTLVPDVSAPILAWRLWNIDSILNCLRTYSSDEPFEYIRIDRLLSLNNEVWPKGKPLKARCSRWLSRSCSGPAPSYHCQCGIYAARDPRELDSFSLCPKATLWGQVALWGRVVVHEQGYRAEYAYPRWIAPYCGDADEVDVENIALGYGIGGVAQLRFDLGLEEDELTSSFKRRCDAHAALMQRYLADLEHDVVWIDEDGIPKSSDEPGVGGPNSHSHEQSFHESMRGAKDERTEGLLNVYAPADDSWVEEEDPDPCVLAEVEEIREWLLDQYSEQDINGHLMRPAGAQKHFIFKPEGCASRGRRRDALRS